MLEILVYSIYSSKYSKSPPPWVRPIRCQKEWVYLGSDLPNSTGFRPSHIENRDQKLRIELMLVKLPSLVYNNWEFSQISLLQLPYDRHGMLDSCHLSFLRPLLYRFLR